MQGQRTGARIMSPMIFPRVVTTRVRSWLMHVLLISVMVLVGTGCPTIQYQPNDRLVDDLGVQQSRQRLQDTLVRSVNPQIIDVETTEDAVLYRYRQPIYGPYWSVLGYNTVENRIFFNNLGRVDLFENGVVLVRAQAEHLIAQFVFSDTNDSKTLADLLMSFHARRARMAR